MDIHNPERVLGGQGRGGSHGIAAMRRNHLLICLETPIEIFQLAHGPLNFEGTYAPPELSEPAITRTRP